MPRFCQYSLVILLLIGSLATGPLFSADDDGQSPPSMAVWQTWRHDFSNTRLLDTDIIRKTLSLSDEQSKQQKELLNKRRDKIRAALALADKRQVRPAILAAFEQTEADVLKTLSPEKQARLGQIRLQIQGPTAFEFDDLQRRLELSEEKIGKIRAVTTAAQKQADQAATVLLPFQHGDGTITVAAVQSFVESERFLTAKERAWKEFFAGRAETIRQIEQSLSPGEVDAYHKALGEPYDVEAFFASVAPRGKAPEHDIQNVASALGLQGQRPDPTFPVAVANPAYVAENPAVLFDEAHHNFHTSDGRYKTFAQLITNDGYRVTPNKSPFSPEGLKGFQILVIANAMAAEEMGSPDAGNSAFSDAECTAVAEWVNSGGSLLLVTDHAPFGGAATNLAKRFGVRMSGGAASDEANETDDGLLFSREKKLLGDNAITNGRDKSERVNRVLTFTGQSLQGPPGCSPILKFSETATDESIKPKKSAAGWCQGLALRHGRGRVVVMGEAAELSAQLVGFPPEPMGMNAPGCDNRQMVLNILHWLSGLTD